MSQTTMKIRKEQNRSPVLVAPSLLDCLGVTKVGLLIHCYLEPGEPQALILNAIKPGPTLLEVATIDGIESAILCFLRPSELYRVALVNRTTRQLCQDETISRVFSSQLPMLLKDSEGNKTLCLSNGDSSGTKQDEDKPTCVELPLKTRLLSQQGLSFRGDHRFKLDSTSGIEQRQIEITKDGGPTIVLSFYKKTRGKPTSQDVSLFVVNFTAINGLLPSLNNA